MRYIGERQILYDFNYMYNLKTKNRSRHTNTENKLAGGCQRGGGWEWKNILKCLFVHWVLSHNLKKAQYLQCSFIATKNEDIS